MLAQLVEQRTFNPFVVGSTPAHPTTHIIHYQVMNKIKGLREIVNPFSLLHSHPCPR
jgi:hypothetical protein